jgi:hypothetical protein
MRSTGATLPQCSGRDGTKLFAEQTILEDRDMTETFAEEVARLQREIGERQQRLHHLVLGDQSKCVSSQDQKEDRSMPLITDEMVYRMRGGRRNGCANGRCSR